MTLLNIDNPFTKLKSRYLVLRFILLSVILGLLLKILQVGSSLKLNENDLGLIIRTISVVLLCFWLLKDFQRLRVKLKYVVGDLPKNQNWLWLAGLFVVAMIFYMGIGLVLLYLLSLVAPSFVGQSLSGGFDTTVNRFNSFEYNLLVTLATCLIAPITQEFIFRGVILQRFCTKWGIHAGLLSSSLLFGCLNFDPTLSFFGIILGVLYMKTRSLIVPIAFNALINILVMLMGLLNSNPGNPALEQLQNLQSYWRFGIIFMAISLPFLLHFFWHNWPRKNIVIPYLSNANEGKGIARDVITH